MQSGAVPTGCADAWEARFKVLEKTLAIASVFNLLLVAALGVLLRSFPFLESFPLQYRNILHGHSHFAFGGWVMPGLLLLVLKFFPEVKRRVAFRHWLHISMMVLLSAYGMLLTFPLQGYRFVPLFFSTLSVAASFYFVAVVWKSVRGSTLSTSQKFLKAGIFYLALSALGPFATGPLVAMGMQGTPLYFNAIYFYIHFQVNGFFSFAILAIIYRMIEKRKRIAEGRNCYIAFHLACMPAFFLSVLWNKPPLMFNLVGGLSAALQLAGLFFLLRDLARHRELVMNWLFRLSLAAFCLKLLLQFFSAFPAVAAMAYEQRNFIIAYLHLAVLGFISLFMLERMIALHSLFNGRVARMGTALFAGSFVLTEGLMVASGLGILPGFISRYYTELLLFSSMLFPAGLLMMIPGFLSTITRKNGTGIEDPVPVLRNWKAL